jgi:hypothetical protein
MAEVENIDFADPLDPVDVATAQSLKATTRDEAVSEAQSLLRSRREAYVRVFSDRAVAGDGALVLADLKKFCRGNQTPWHSDPRIHALLTGRFEVFTRINQHMTLNFDDLWTLLNVSEE